MKTWRFSALDSLFFREARPFDSIGGSELSTVFPPSPVTVAGAIRSAIGNHQNINWANYAGSELEKQLGGSDSLGSMRIKGVFLSRNLDLSGFKNPKGLNANDKWQRLYPVPAHLVATQEKGKLKQLHFLQVGKPVHCDLGKAVQLAVSSEQGIKPLENYWLTQAGFEKVLKGEFPKINQEHPENNELISAFDLFTKETHLGIGRNNQTRSAEQGLLYQTQHIRPKKALAIEVDIDCLESINYPTSGIVRLGGEGRGAAFDVFDKVGWAEARSPSLTNSARRIKLILLSALFVPQPAKEDCSMTASPLKDWQSCYTPLPNFKQHEEQDNTVWKGQINGIALTLHCAIIGKTVREGGWDLQKREPKPVRSLIPAGSVFYCTLENSGDIGQQFDQQDDLDKALGRGLFAVCPWSANDSKGNTK